MYHCPVCGEMVLAGMEHMGEPEDSDFDDWPDPNKDLET